MCPYLQYSPWSWISAMNSFKGAYSVHCQLCPRERNLGKIPGVLSRWKLHKIAVYLVPPIDLVYLITTWKDPWVSEKTHGYLERPLKAIRNKTGSLYISRGSFQIPRGSFHLPIRRIKGSFHSAVRKRGVIPDTKGSFHQAIRCIRAIGGTGNTAILGNFHLERPLRIWKEPRGLSKGSFPGTSLTVYTRDTLS